MKVVNEFYTGWFWRIWKHSCFELFNGPGNRWFHVNLWGLAISFRIAKTTRTAIYLIPGLYLNLSTVEGETMDSHTFGVGTTFLILDFSINLFKNIPHP